MTVTGFSISVFSSTGSQLSREFGNGFIKENVNFIDLVLPVMCIAVFTGVSEFYLFLFAVNYF